MSEWYRGKEALVLGRKSLRILDADTGYWIICWRRRTGTLCYLWDPGRFEFIGRVEEFYVCGLKMCKYCTRKDKSKNARVESMSCLRVYTWRTRRYRSIRHMYKYIRQTADALITKAGETIEKCFGREICDTGEKRVGAVALTYTPYVRFLGYDRCDDRYYVCDIDTCHCTRGERKVKIREWLEGEPSKPVYLPEEEENLFDELCWYSETKKRWFCETY